MEMFLAKSCNWCLPGGKCSNGFKGNKHKGEWLVSDVEIMIRIKEYQEQFPFGLPNFIVGHEFQAIWDVYAS